MTTKEKEQAREIKRLTKIVDELRADNQVLMHENETIWADATNWQRLVSYFAEAKHRVMPPWLVSLMEGKK